jgi:hypothetical protein
MPRAGVGSLVVVAIAVGVSIFGVACAQAGTGDSGALGGQDNNNNNDYSSNDTQSSNSNSNSNSNRNNSPPKGNPVFDSGSFGSFDAGSGQDAADAAATSIASLFPAALGHSWTFEITSNFQNCQGTHTGSVIGENGNQFTITPICDNNPNATVVVSTQSVDVAENGGTVHQIAEPVAEGATFTTFNNNTATWHSEGTVTLPAGTFSNCWRTTIGPSFTIYCPGAGTVHIHEEQQNGSVDALLKSKNF